jgi:hypothetical protein
LIVDLRVEEGYGMVRYDMEGAWNQFKFMGLYGRQMNVGQPKGIVDLRVQ